MPRKTLFVPCHCGCGGRIDITDRWHFVSCMNAWFATPECFNEHPNNPFGGE